MKKRLPIILAFVLLVLSLSNSACSLTKPADEIYNNFSPTAEVFAEETAISRFVQMGDKSLTIDAVLSPVDLNKMPEIRLSFDKNTLTKMVNDIVLVKYPQVTESIMDGNSLWSILRDDGSVELSFSCSPEGLFSGLVFYVDAERDVTGENLDPDGSIWIPHYITQLKPDDISFSAKEAGNRICSLLSGYSCFDYAPRSIVAQYDRQLGKGCYHLWLQPFLRALRFMETEYLGYGLLCLKKIYFSFRGLWCSWKTPEERWSIIILLETRSIHLKPRCLHMHTEMKSHVKAFLLDI